MSTPLDPATADATLEYPKGRDLCPGDQLLLAVGDGDGGVEFKIATVEAVTPEGQMCMAGSDLIPAGKVGLDLSLRGGALIERIVDTNAILPRLAHHHPERLPETL